jgi:hypothetical protein
MAKAKKKRTRAGYVMVELDEELRAMLEAIKDDRAREIEESVSLASTVRSLIRADFARRGLGGKSKKSSGKS